MSSMGAKVRGQIEVFMTEVGNGGGRLVTDGEAVEDMPGSGLGQGVESDKPKKICWVQ